MINFLAALDFEKSRHDRSKILEKIGDIFWDWGDTYAAERFYQLSVSDEERRENLEKLIVAKFENMKPEAQDLLRRLAKFGMVPSNVLYHCGRYLVRVGRMEEAQDILMKIPRGSLYFNKARYVAGVAFLSIGDKGTALGMFEDAIPGVGEMAIIAAARVAHDVGDMEKAERYYKMIPRNSKYYHEGLYELAWVLYEKGDFKGADEVLKKFRRTRNTWLTRRGDVLDGYLIMLKDELLAFAQFDEIIRNYEEFLVKLEEIKGIKKSDFWEKGEYVIAFMRIEPKIREWVKNHPEMEKMGKLERELEKLDEMLERTFDEITQIENTASIFAERMIQKNMDILWWIHERLQILLVLPILDLMTPEERNAWEFAMTLRREIKTLDREARQIRKTAFTESRKIAPQTGESESARKLYRALVEAGNSTSDELIKIQGYQRESMMLIMDMTDIFYEKYREILEPHVKRIRKLLRESSRLRGILEYLYHRISLLIHLRAKEERKRLQAIIDEIERMKGRLKEVKVTTIKEIVTEDIRKEQEETSALAQMGFIEAAWKLKEKEASLLDELWIERKKVQEEIDRKAKKLKKETEFKMPVEKTVGESYVKETIVEAEKHLRSIESIIKKFEEVRRKIKEGFWKP